MRIVGLSPTHLKGATKILQPVPKLSIISILEIPILCSYSIYCLTYQIPQNGILEYLRIWLPSNLFLRH